MSPRTFDDIPVSTVFAEEKSRENSDTRKSTTSLKSQNSRKISRESRDSKKSKKSEKSEKSNQSENEPDSTFDMGSSELPPPGRKSLDRQTGYF